MGDYCNISPWDAGNHVPGRDDVAVMPGWRKQLGKRGQREGWLTPNEARQMQGLAPVAGGDLIDVTDAIIGEPDLVRGDDYYPVFTAALRRNLRPFLYGFGFLLLLWGCMAATRMV